MKKRKALTLIEVVLSMAIISIMIVAVLGVFNISITNIFKSGQRTEDVLKSKEYIDEQIKINEDKTAGKDNVTISIGDFKTDIEGNFIEVENIGDEFNIPIKTFIPVKKTLEKLTTIEVGNEKKIQQ